LCDVDFGHGFWTRLVLQPDFVIWLARV
jgi:hypothetical protein